jgi:hypothetical protein
VRLFKKQLIVFTINITMFLGLISTITNFSTSYFEGEATSGTTSFNLPTTASDSATAFTTATIFSGTGGLASISPSQTIISSANTVTRFYLGVNGYLIGDKTLATGGLFRFKTSQFITSITATFTKFESELSTVYIQSGWVAPVSTGTDSRETYKFLEGDSTINVTYSNLRSYYFEIGLGLISGSLSSTTNNAYLTALTFDYNSARNPISLLDSYNFIDGGTASNSTYSGDSFATTVSDETDDPSVGVSIWSGRWANASLTTGTRLGTPSTNLVQASEKTNNDGWPYIATSFNSSSVINAIYVLNLVNQTGTGVANIILQTSNDSGTTWTGLSYKTLSDINNGILDFGLLNIPIGSRFRIGLTTSSTTQVLIHFTGIQVFSFVGC